MSTATLVLLRSDPVLVLQSLLENIRALRVKLTESETTVTKSPYHQSHFSAKKSKYLENRTKTKLRGLSPRANYTDRAAAAGRRS